MDESSQKSQEEIGIGSIGTFIKTMAKFLQIDPDYEYYFRGHSSKDHELIPSIYRNSGWIKNEDKMFRELILRCPDEFHELETTFQKLVKMQHYALPTRLLDLTGNPLIALFFACQDNMVKSNKGKEISTDGEVIIFRIPKDTIKYFDSDRVSVVSNISKQPFNFEFNIKKNESPTEFSKQDSIKLLLHDIRHEKSFFEPNIKSEHLKSVICVKPMLDNPRILRQDGAFFLFGVDGKKKEFSRIPEEYIYKLNKSRLIIKNNGKRKIQEQLKVLGINTSRIYPEVDHAASYVKDSFKEKDNTIN